MTVPPRNPIPYARFQLPVTLPSNLVIATVELPIPMNASDFDYFMAQLASWKEALINPPGLGGKPIVDPPEVATS